MSCTNKKKIQVLEPLWNALYITIKRNSFHLYGFDANDILNSKSLKVTLFFSAALSYLLHHIDSDLDKKAFEEACGVGVVVTPEDIEDAVSFTGLSLKVPNVPIQFPTPSLIEIT